VKKIGLAVLGVVLFATLAVATYRVLGIRIALDGSGSRPRFFSWSPDYDALEANRARPRPTAADTPAAPADSPTPPSTEPATAQTGAQRAGATSGNSPTQSTGAIAPVGGGSASVPTSTSAHEQWTDFRGSNRDGRYVGRIRTEWPQGGLPLLWKQPIGPGYASFVAADGRAFTIEQRRSQEVVAAYDIATGRELWQQGWPGDFRESMGGDGPRATPTLHNGRLYVLGALGELRCHDARTGTLVWRRNILADAGASNLGWGMAASPLVIEGPDPQSNAPRSHEDDLVIVLPGGSRGHSVAAYAAASGELRWTALDDQQAYTAPMRVTLGGVRQLLVVTATRVVGLTLDGGGPLWEYPWGNPQGISVGQPILLEGDRIFISASYGAGAAVFEVARSGEAFVTRNVWRNARMKNKFTSSLLHDGFIYGLDEAILTCLDAATGDQKWKGGRYGYGQTLLAGDDIVVLTEDGDLVLVRATPERHEEVSRFPAISGKTWNHPIIVDGRLLVRNISEMAAFDIRP
jgi:outer membrane protein assembly factor BamB